MTYTALARWSWALALVGGYVLVGGLISLYTYTCYGIERPAGGEWGSMIHFYVFVVLLPLLALVSSLHLQTVLYGLFYRVRAHVKGLRADEAELSWSVFALMQLVLSPLSAGVTALSVGVVYEFVAEPLLRGMPLSQGNDFFAMSFAFLALLPPYLTAQAAIRALFGARADNRTMNMTCPPRHEESLAPQREH